MLFQIDHRSSRLAALLSELFCPLSLPLVLALISLQQLQYDSFIHLLPFIVVIARNSISLAIGIDVIFFLLSEGGPVESKKRHCKWRALTLIINKALLRSWGLGHIIKERIPRKGVKLRLEKVSPAVASSSVVGSSSDSEWVREVLGLSPNVGLEALAESLNIPEGSQDKDSLKEHCCTSHDMGKGSWDEEKKEKVQGEEISRGKAVATRGVDSELRLNRKQQAASTTLKAGSVPPLDRAPPAPNVELELLLPWNPRHEMPIKSVKGSLIKAGKQEDLTELMMDRISKGERLS
ncbi:hypothetical protein L1987_89728 [Smallanthus sonchifolius]|nr:hypothetical protein L1987_89728 [Smallanthus sonchifolius]